jgi:D-alanyl-D-alanine carboxypeptidase (penicillin-binding protein 5/6)
VPRSEARARLVHADSSQKGARPSLRALAALLAIAAVVGLLAASAEGADRSATSLAKITAPSFVAIDADSGAVLVARRATVRRPIASLTKVMTGLLEIERGRLSDRIRVPAAAAAVEDYREGLVPGRRYRRITLLRSALMVSANDSATALALDGGDGSLARFYTLMNSKARAVGMTGTVYASASGLDDVHNVSTALDQALLARVAMRNQTFAAIVGTARYVTRWAAPTYSKIWVNHNKMLSAAPGTYGVKTGWTTRAGGCLIIAQRRGGRSVIGVVLASQSIWSDMTKMLDAAFAS